MKKFIPISLLFLLLKAQAGAIDVSHDNNKSGRTVNTVVVSREIDPRVSFITIADSTKYGELYLGRTFPLGALSVTPYLGVESVGAGSAKLRGMLVSSVTLGSFSFSSVVEFAGVTGNFNKKQISYTTGPVTTSLVHHSVAGSGIRINYKSGHFTPYVQSLARRTTLGFIASW